MRREKIITVTIRTMPKIIQREEIKKYLEHLQPYDKDDDKWRLTLNEVIDLHCISSKPVVFYTGSLDDVKWLSEDAMVRVMDRRWDYEISGSIVRYSLRKRLRFDNLVPSEIIPDVKRAWKEYRDSRTNSPIGE